MWLSLRAGLVSLLILAAFLGVWHVGTAGTGTVVKMDPEYAKLMGVTATQGKSAMPGPADVGAKILAAPARSRSTTRAPTTRASASSSPTRSRACWPAICWRWRWRSRSGS